MKTRLQMLGTFAILGALVTGCDQAQAPQASTPAGTSASAPQTALGRAAKTAIDKARVELVNGNINLNGEIFSPGHHTISGGSRHKNPADPRPDAEITPAGDLLIDGKPVSVTTEQHAMLIEYRQSIITVAEAGMDIGVKGADLGGAAIGEVISGLMSGHPEQIEKNIDAKAGNIEAAAMQLCKQLRPMQETQQRLAASLPAFAPYATLKTSDIDDCETRKDRKHVTFATDADRAEIRDEIRDRIRSGVRETVQAGAKVTGDEAPAPAATPAR